MNKYKTYVDESGNTGDNLVDKNQPFFTLAAVSIPSKIETKLANYIQQAFVSVKEKEEIEIKTTKWTKAPKKYKVLKDILSYLKAEGCDFSFIIIEKRFMVTCLIVDNFLDGAYNDIKDYTWCNNKDEKIKASCYFYNNLTNDDINFIASALNKPTIEKYNEVLNRIIAKTDDSRYLTMLEGCHYEDVCRGDININSGAMGLSLSVARSPNYTAFCSLGMKIANFCKEKQYSTEIIFDSCFLYNDAYKNILEIFQHMHDDIVIEKISGLFSWNKLIESYKVADSKDSFLLQSADILATSITKTLSVIFKGKALNKYDIFILSIIKDMLKDDSFQYVTCQEYEDRLIKALKQLI